MNITKREYREHIRIVFAPDEHKKAFDYVRKHGYYIHYSGPNSRAKGKSLIRCSRPIAQPKL